MAKTGTLYGLSVGPGDPELMTLKAWRLLAVVPVIAFPRTSSGDTLARRIVSPFVPDDIIELPIELPMCSDREPAQRAYDTAQAEIERHLDDGRDVAFLCEGDAFFYGSFMYLAARMAPRYQLETVPGVTSLTACAAATGIPLAGRNDILKILPAPLCEETLAGEAATAHSIAIIKVGRHFDKVKRTLKKLDLDSKAVVIESASLENQRVQRLNDMADGEKPYFSTILVYCGNEAWS